MDLPKCGHSPATCNGDICLRDEGAHREPSRELQIEGDHAARLEHARAIYHMAVQAAESTLDAAVAEADEIRRAELARLRREAHEAAEKATLALALAGEHP